MLTADPRINVTRVKIRAISGGHDVPEEKILNRYNKALKLLPELLEICDVCHIYDNSVNPYRIFKKRKEKHYFWENSLWKIDDIEKLTKYALNKSMI